MSHLFNHFWGMGGVANEALYDPSGPTHVLLVIGLTIYDAKVVSLLYWRGKPLSSPEQCQERRLIIVPLQPLKIW
jgi:hypothetical protein